VVATRGGGIRGEMQACFDYPPPPVFFVSVDSKGARLFVRRADTADLRGPVNVDSKGSWGGGGKRVEGVDGRASVPHWDETIAHCLPNVK